MTLIAPMVPLQFLRAQSFGLLVGMLLSTAAEAKEPAKQEELWSLKPLVRPAVPAALTPSTNPIDAFIAERHRERGLAGAAPAGRHALLRRVSLDLIGLPPTREEQETFANDTSPRAYEAAVDRLLASQQYGVRQARHWLDVLRYADVDENMPATPGIHYWRDWVIHQLNQDLPYDAFVRAQILGNRAAERRIISAAGHLTPVEPRPEDLFALGFLARGATSLADTDHQLAFSAVEAISSAFLGLTYSCARCHDHFYDPIKQSEYYSMKSLFDPLVLRRIDLATPDQVFARGRKIEEHESRLKVAVDTMRQFIEPFHHRLYEERLSVMPSDVQAAIRKPQQDRTGAEQKVYDDYYPILRIDPPKIKAVMKPEEVERYNDYLKQIAALKAPEPLPVFWTVAEDAKRAAETNYVLITGDPARPKKSSPVASGFPFAPERFEFRDGRREGFVDWLTSPDNPLFARVAVNRIWQWHFGVGLHEASSDFGALGGQPTHPKLLDWLAVEFVARGYRMKWLHRLIVTSETYRRATSAPLAVESANCRADPDNTMLWKHPLRRLEAEPIRDSLLMAAGTLDLTVGGKSFDGVKPDAESNRRAAYMSRGYRSFADSMPDYLQTFDADDGRAACPRRNQTVTATQALLMMNSEFIEGTAAAFGDRLRQQSSGDNDKLVNLGFTTALNRPPDESERSKALSFLSGDPNRAKGFAWILLNLDEFLYIR